MRKRIALLHLGPLTEGAVEESLLYLNNLQEECLLERSRFQLQPENDYSLIYFLLKNILCHCNLMLIDFISLKVHTDSFYQKHIKEEKSEILKGQNTSFILFLSLLTKIKKSIASTEINTERPSFILEIAHFVCKHNGLTLWVMACKKDTFLNIPEIEAGL